MLLCVQWTLSTLLRLDKASFSEILLVANRVTHFSQCVWDFPSFTMNALYPRDPFSTGGKVTPALSRYDSDGGPHPASPPVLPIRRNVGISLSPLLLCCDCNDVGKTLSKL